ncbi:MAG: hypothetical protein H6737_26380 [Alphaproteobacteria bacterium]|nr:hypothetical protein [Alphaproteobacteria bacterium]
MEADLLWAMGSHTVFSAPLMVMWLVALVVGVRMLGSSRAAGLCLITAGLLELLRLGLGILLVPLPAILHGAGVLGTSGLSGFALARGILNVLAIMLAYTLLIASMFGWRSARE